MPFFQKFALAYSCVPYWGGLHFLRAYNAPVDGALVDTAFCKYTVKIDYKLYINRLRWTVETINAIYTTNNWMYQ